MIDLKYLAGLVDGEGCVTIFRHRTKACAADHWTYRPVLQIGMVYKPLIKMLHAQFGGNYAIKGARDKTRRPYAVWSVRGNRCIELLQTMLPHLIVKQAEADLLIQFWNDPSARLKGGAMKGLHGVEREALKARREYYRLTLQAMKKQSFGAVWDESEFGETPMPGPEMDAEGQSRAKQIRLVA